MPGRFWSRRRWNEHILTGNKAAAWGVPSCGGCRATAAGSEGDTQTHGHDGDVDDVGDHQSPVCFVRDTKMAATVKVAVSPAACLSGAVRIRGDGPGNLDFPATVATVGGGTATITAVVCESPFPNNVQRYDPLDIRWEVLIEDGGNRPAVPTRSKNEVFVTLEEPQCATRFRTVLYLATQNGGTDYDTCLTNTWGMFSTGAGPANVKAWNPAGKQYDRPLHYYQNHSGDYVTTAAGLLANGNGQCHSWAELFKEALVANGVPNVMRTRVRPPVGFFRLGVKNVAFDYVAPAYPAYHPWQYGITAYDAEDREVDDLDITVAGLAGQNADPPYAKLFSRHFIVHRSGDIDYYDPSYGVAAAGADAYTQSAVDAWGAIIGGIEYYRERTTPDAALRFTDELW